ncbi:MAG: nucleotidyltransferase domain-containing protein [Chloroflexota bacterium]
MSHSQPSFVARNAILQEVTRRIVDTASPVRVLLFGSTARRQANRDSDLDLLVVMRGPVHRRRLAQEIYRNLRGVGVPVDIVVATEDDLEEFGQSPGTILKPALKEGLVVYEA